VRFVVGVDLGQTADYTAITILEEREEKSYDVRYLERLRNTPYPAIVRRLDHLVRRLPEKPSMAVDATGVGRPVIDMIKDAQLPASVYPITLTGGDAVVRDGMERRVPKRDVASTIAVLLQTGRLRIARGLQESDTLLRELLNFRVKISLSGHDTYRIGYQATMKKVVSDRRASLDEETEVKPALRRVVEEEFRRGASIPVLPFPKEGAEIPDTPRLTLVVAEPETEWTGAGPLRAQLSEWTRQRGKSPRLYPGALVWCLKKPGRDLRDKVELSLAWKRVAREVNDGTLGGEFDKSDRADLQTKVKDAEGAAKEGVWGDYRFAVVADPQADDGLKVIDLGAGHSSSGETLCGRVVTALKSNALLNESVGAGYVERNWPPALKESGEWPLASLRQSFLNGSLTRLVDPESTLRGKILEFVDNGDFGLASGRKTDGTFDRLWFQEMVAPDEIAFDAGVYLLRKDAAAALKSGATPAKPQPQPPELPPPPPPDPGKQPPPTTATKTLRVAGNVPPELWNRLGTKILPKLRAGTGLTVRVDFSVTVKEDVAASMATDLKQVLHELGLSDSVRVE
jgi:hypothetical protein